MPRIPVFIYTADPATGNALPSVTCTVKNRITNTNVSLFSAETGGSSVTNPLTSDSLGRAFAWTERVPLKIDYSGAGITPYTEYRGDGAQPTFESTLPGSPYDGQEIYYQNAAMATAGIVWHFRYRAGGGTYKWEAVNSPTAIYAEVTTNQFIGSSSYTDLATAGPSITLPLAGDYDVTVGGSISSGASGVIAYMSYQIGGTAANDADALQAYVYNANASYRDDVSVNMLRTRRKTGLSAVTLTAKYRSASGANNVYAQHRVLSATPIRVG